MKKLTLTLMTVIIGVLLTVPAFAFGPGGGSGHHREAMWAKLKLTDDQKAKIENLQTAFQKDIKPVREKLFDKSVELRRLWLQPNPDKEKIVALQKQVRALRDEIQDKATTMRLEIRQLLTPEQQEKLANSRWGQGQGFGPRGGIRGPGGFGHGMGNGMCDY